MASGSKEYSPFSPGQPVRIEDFAGRTAELEALNVQASRVCGSCRPAASFIAGERGIGKSSLAEFYMHQAQSKHDMLAITVRLGGVLGVGQVCRKILDKTLKASVDRLWFDKLVTMLGDAVSKVQLFGIGLEFNPTGKEIERLEDEFDSVIRRVWSQIAEHKKGMLLVLDDINGICDNDRFAPWLKSLVEELGSSDSSMPLQIVLVGLDERREALIARQPSLGRILEVFDVLPLSEKEELAFLRRAFGGVGLNVDDEALGSIHFISQGHPAVIHEIGDAVYQVNTDEVITDKDAQLGALRAAETLGRRYLEGSVLTAIRSESYKRMLKNLRTIGMGVAFTRKEVLAKLGDRDRGRFDNFLKRLRRLGVIELDEDKGRGAYRFSRLIDYLYLWLVAGRG